MRKSVKRFDSPSTSENGITNNSYHNESHPTLDYSRVQFDSYGKSRPIHTIAYKPKPKAWLSSRNMYRYLLGFLLCSFVATVVILGSLLGTDSFPFQKPYRLDEAATKPLMKRLRDAVSPESASREVKFGGAFLVLNEVYYADLSNPNSDLYKARVAEYRVRLLRSFVGTAFAPLLQNIEIAGFSGRKIYFSSGSLRVIFELTFQMSPGQSMSDTSLRSVLESVILRNSIVDSPFYEQDIPVSSLQIWSSDLPPTTQVTTTTTAATFAPIIFTLTTPAVGPITTQRPINYTSMPTLSTTTTSLVSQQLSTVESDSDPLDIFTSFLETPSFPMCSQNSPPGCYDGVIPHCSDMGYQKTKYPNLLGHKTVDEVMAALGLFKLVESLKCHQSAHNFTCHVLQPQCESDNNATTYPLCRPFCTGVLEGCSKFFEVTDIPSKLKCSQLNDADECYQACADSDFVCNKSEFCLPMVKQCNHQFDCGPGDLSDEMGCECNGTELFLCNNTVCIPEAKHCDNVNDCGEWLDERGCECPKGMKQCATTGQCFPARKWCDKVFDCADSSDESGCICAPSDIKCQEGYCKAGDSHCNGINDCKDFSDELDCECSDLEFRCDRFLCKSYIKHWCNGRPDCDDKSDEPANCTCKAYQFKCANGQCIPIFEMCDQKPNCDDNSDELNCPCNIHEFTCPTGGCIPKEQVCDGKKQCKDGADERQNCPCKQDEFQCSDGTCTSIAQWCDGKKDCSDGSDETVGCKKVCPANFPVRCDTFLRGNVCLHGNLVCDGIADCKDNQDEQNCACKPETQMRCNDGTCKPWGVYCNGVKDCFDGSDEPVGCVCNPQNQLMCQSGECYDKRTRCDGIPMCKDKSDELNCTCAERIKLTSPEKICDKNVDCPDFSDELLCANCNTTSFVCGTIGPCVDWTKVCDGQKDCPNGDDERNCLHLYQDQNSITPNYWEYNNVGILFGLQGRNWYKVCAENIQKTLTTKDQLMRMANESCQKYFHYKRVAKFQLITDPAPAQVYVYIENPSNFAQLRLLTTLCPSRLVISMECEEVECGSRPAAPLIKTRIVGGSSTMMGKWPFYVAIFKEGKQHCGSTLINDQWVLTAAHCFNSALLQDENIWDKSGVKSPKETRNSDDLIEDDNPATSYAFVLRGGIYKSSSATPFDQFRRVTHVIRHPNYNQMTGVNDLALLKVDKPFSFSSYVMPVCMPKRREPVKPGIRCHIVGMGSLAWKFHGSEDVQEVELPVMDSSDCRKFPTINAEVRIIDSQICAGFPEGGKDTCQGDSGGPLFCQNSDGFWTLVGATSRGYACAKPLTPGVYSKVAAFLDWIYAVTNNQNLPKTNMSCPIGEFQCVYGKCVPNAKVCNGIPDCSFAEDESGCQTLTGGSTTPLPASSTGGISTTPSIVGTTGVPTGPVGPTGVTGGQSTVPSGTPTATGAVGTTAAQSSLAPGTSAIVGTTTQPAAKKKPWWLGYGK